MHADPYLELYKNPDFYLLCNQGPLEKHEDLTDHSRCLYTKL